jgi:hypothetical protein
MAVPSSLVVIHHLSGADAAVALKHDVAAGLELFDCDAIHRQEPVDLYVGANLVDFEHPDQSLPYLFLHRLVVDAVRWHDLRVGFGEAGVIGIEVDACKR